MSYSELLKDPRWQKKRLEIFERDNWQCRECGSKQRTLHVHHKIYKYGRSPWEYDNDCLLTLCEQCHEIEESFKKQNEFIAEIASASNGTCLEFCRIIARIAYCKTNEPNIFSEILKKFRDFQSDQKFSDFVHKHCK
jgi:hypothetical protein